MCTAGARGMRRAFTYRGRLNMLWTILVVLLIIALVLFIVGRMRGRRGV